MTKIDLKRLSRRVIRQAIKDVGIGTDKQSRMAMIFVRSEDFKTHMERADYPELLSGAIEDLVLRSKAQRRVMTREIIEVLEEF